MTRAASAKVTAAFTVEFSREEDGRLIAEVPELPGVMVYGDSKVTVLAKVKALAFRVLADREEKRASRRSHEHVAKLRQ
jgi:predicted RNase H-like HicB family nuclease